jgi:hypothetical protein
MAHGPADTDLKICEVEDCLVFWYQNLVDIAENSSFAKTIG